MEQHKKELIELYVIGSWAAKEIVDKFDITSEEISRDKILSERLFLGDSEMQSFLNKSYWKK